VGQEQEGKAVLGRLDELGPRDEEFEDLLAQFTSAGRARIAFEEMTVWPSLRLALTAREADHLGRRRRTAWRRRATVSPGSPGGAFR
jgi:hypothetical protein